MLKDGQMVEKGSYNELVAKQGDFANFVQRHQNEDAEEDTESGKRVREEMRMGEKVEDIHTYIHRCIFFNSRL